MIYFNRPPTLAMKISMSSFKPCVPVKFLVTVSFQKNVSFGLKKTPVFKNIAYPFLYRFFGDGGYIVQYSAWR